MEDNARHNFEKLIKDLESDVARGDVQAMKWLGDVLMMIGKLNLLVNLFMLVIARI